MTTEVPRVGVGVFVFNQSGQFLLGHRQGSIGADTWALPGGHLEFGESWEECAERETLEETNLKTVSPPQFLTATNNIMPGENRHYVTIFMTARTERPDALKLMEPNKCKAWEWVWWDDLLRWGDDQDSDTSRKLFSPLVNLLQQRPGLRPEDAA